MEKLFIEDLPLKGQKLLMRVDYNVPLDSDLNIVDASRIQASLPSIRYALDQGAALILMSHLGRPHNMPSKNLSLKPCAQFLSTLLNLDVKIAPNCIGYSVQEMVKKLKPQEILLLENLRFHRGEEFPEEDLDFAKELASYGNFYVNDAFGSSHRKHSSVYTITQFFPQKAAAGYLLDKEMRFLDQILVHPKRPLCALIGGSKVSSKIGLLKALIEKVDILLIGGAMSFTFLKAHNINIGDSLFEKDFVPLAHEIISLAKEKGVELVLPIDSIIATECSRDVKTSIVDLKNGIASGNQGFDIGPKSIALFQTYLNRSKTVLWNGPVGVYELSPFAQGSLQIAKILASSKAITIVGGGDSVAVVQAAEVADKITHISTGGGATLEYIEQGTLPGIEALSEKIS